MVRTVKDKFSQRADIKGRKERYGKPNLRV